ncbi:hypothetical protein V5O48_002025 [Marasmius crinis-equi]|uniref:Alkaline phosphatase D n=1 Tax=Marasmius crinis-equi TaxID=585013 RepID=A0ABR3FX87_9AGAR
MSLIAVASGDPFDTSVILWTRAVPTSPDGTSSLPDQSVPACLSYKVSTNEQPNGNPVTSGEAFTSYDVDWTVKVEATRLKPDTKYFFQFSDCANPSSVSPVGTTRTLASPNTPANKVNGGNPLTLAVFSCSQYQAGYFNAYGVAAHNTTADVFIHLGDYIYESLGNGSLYFRVTAGSFSSRMLHSVLGSDVKHWEGNWRQFMIIANALINIVPMRALLSHTSTPLGSLFGEPSSAFLTPCGMSIRSSVEFGSYSIQIVAIDLNRTTTRSPTMHGRQAKHDGMAGTADSNDTAVGCSFSPSGACFTDRKLAAVRAYHEWMPIRQVDAGDQLRIWRNFRVGQLLDLTMLDTRQYDRDLTDVYYNTGKSVKHLLNVRAHHWIFRIIAAFPNRSLMGADQESWLYETLSESKQRGAVWRVLGQQIVFTQLNESGSFDLDAWDGYRANRQRVLDHLYKNKISNTVILAGDSHANWVSDLAHPNDSTTYDPVSGKGAIGVEFAGTAVTSSSFASGTQPDIADGLSRVLVETDTNLNLQWSEAFYRGFFTLTIDPKTLTATYYAMQNISACLVFLFKATALDAGLF